MTRRKKRKKRKAIVKLFVLLANAKVSHRNMQYLPQYMSKCLGDFFLGLLERRKCQFIHFFPVPVIVKTAISRLAIRRFDLVLKVC